MINNRGSFWGSIPPITKNLITINFICWLATLLLPSILRQWDISFDLVDVLGLHYWGASRFNPAQLVTYMFLHDGFSHLFFNMFALYMFGGVLEQLWGTRRFLFFYLATGIGAGIIQQLFWTIGIHELLSGINNIIASGNPEIIKINFPDLPNYSVSALIEYKVNVLNKLITIGASGAVFGLLLAFGWLFPEAKLMLLFLPIPIPARIFVTLYAVLELFLGVRGFAGDNIAHFAHLGGMLFGAIIILYWKRKKK